MFQRKQNQWSSVELRWWRGKKLRKKLILTSELETLYFALFWSKLLHTMEDKIIFFPMSLVMESVNPWWVYSTHFSAQILDKELLHYSTWIFLMKIRKDVALFDHTVYYCIRMFYESDSLTNWATATLLRPYISWINKY